MIRDRAYLEQMASGCYGAAEAHYRSLFGSFGKSIDDVPTEPARINGRSLGCSVL